MAEEWYEKYPFFDPADFRNTQRQHDYHFFEWLAAIRIYERSGWFSMVEKYDFGNHPRKLCILKLLTTEKQIHALDRRNRPCQCPDLLVYKPDLSDFYFCEVKGPKDRTRPKQEEYFVRLAKRSGKPVCFAKLREV